MQRSAAILALAALPLCGAITQPVKVEGGSVQRIPGKDTSIVFKGVPFAAPPVGDLRWRAPKPVVPWQGARKAVIRTARDWRTGRRQQRSRA